MRIMAWVALAFCLAGFVGAIIAARDGQKFQGAERADGTVTDHKRTTRNLSGGGTTHEESVGMSYINPFTNAEAHFYFRGSSSREATEANYPVGSVHNVWVTEEGLQRCSKEKPDPLNGAPIAAGFGAVMGLLAGFLFWLGRSA